MIQSKHVVQFYLTDDHLLNSVGRFIHAGLDIGAACIIIATDVHQRGLQEQLEVNGFDLSVLSARGKYIRRDAIMMLSFCLTNGVPDPKSFFRMIGQLTAQAEHEQTPVYIFGEMVELLSIQGNKAAALQLEALWNDFLATRPTFSLLCAYQMQRFAGEEHTEPLAEICLQHSQIIPDEAYITLANSQERLRTSAQWPQKALSLSTEVEAYTLAEKRFHHLFEASTDGIVLVDPHDGTIVDVNLSFTDLLGYKREELLKREIWQFDLFPDQEHVKDILQQVEMQQGTWHEIVPLRTRYEEVHVVEVVSSMLQTSPFPIIQCHVHTITDRLRMQAAIQEREKRFHLLANHAPFIIWQSDPGGGGSYFNPAWSTFTGLSEAQSLGTGWIRHIHLRDRKAAFAQWMQTLIERIPYHSQFHIQRPNGHYCLVQIDGHPWTDSDGIFAGYIGTMIELAEPSENTDDQQ